MLVYQRVTHECPCPSDFPPGVPAAPWRAAAAHWLSAVSGGAGDALHSHLEREVSHLDMGGWPILGGYGWFEWINLNVWVFFSGFWEKIHDGRVLAGEMMWDVPSGNLT